MQQITQLIEVMPLAAVVTKLWSGHSGIDTNVGLRAKVPLIAFLGLVHLRSRCCSLFWSSWCLNDGGIDH